MQRSHKIKLKPNAVQTVALKKAVGTARFAYNWGLATWNAQYELSKQGLAEKPDAYKISALWTKSKPEWAKESAASSQQRSFLSLGRAWVGFWNKISEAPKFKRKGNRDSFYIQNTGFKYTNKRVNIPRVGMVGISEPPRFQGKIMSATVSCEAGSWFISISVQLPDLPPSDNPSVVGVDVGIKSIAVASDGSVLDNPKLLKKYAERLAAAQRVLARKEKRSRRREKALIKLQSIHQKIIDVRTDAIHKFTHQLAKNHGTAVIETLDVKGMLINGERWLKCLLQDTAMKEVHRQLEYKMRVVKAPSFYASSKTCSSCGAKVALLDLATRTYECNACGFACDRDLNASYNLRNMRWVTP